MKLLLIYRETNTILRCEITNFNLFFSFFIDFVERFTLNCDKILNGDKAKIRAAQKSRPIHFERQMEMNTVKYGNTQYIVLEN